MESEPKNENSLSRLWRYNERHDCGAITAFKLYNNCCYHNDNNTCETKHCKGGKEPIVVTRKENGYRNIGLAYDLTKLGYTILKIIGSCNYETSSETKKEVSYFVVDSEDNGELEKDLRRLGEKYDQDSVLIIPKGAIGFVQPGGKLSEYEKRISQESAKARKKEDEKKIPVDNPKKAFLVSTNNCENNWLGDKGNTSIFNLSTHGYSTPIYTSKVDGRPFILVENYDPKDNLIFGSPTNAIVAVKYSKMFEK